ncbi:hypothetical protein [Flavobacterium sp. 3HN19-14]|uniref:hypothetical protein n=1 Tax=Flavobacterium sp. 3HN19-14 TaxID=3448133 RepID=UPI003EE356DE
MEQSFIKNSSKENLYKYFFFFIVAFYCLVVSQYGFENWDTGFLSGFSWRVVNGDMIYRDFIHVRPPLSIYFHALFMYLLPENGQFFMFRIVGYLLFACQVYWCLSGFDNLFDLKKIGFSKWGMMIACFVISIHNFFGNPWYNNDGIFFASIAFFLMSKNRNPGFVRISFIALFCFCSALTKQSFYFVPMLFGFWIFIENGFRKSFVFIGSLLLLSGFFIGWLYTNGAYDEFVAQMTSRTSFGDLYYAGLREYVRAYHNKYIFGSVILLPAIIAFFTEKRKIPTISNYLKWLAFTIFLSAIVMLYVAGIKTAMTVFFNAVVVALLYKINFKWQSIKHYLPMIVLIGIAWCVSLSLGYATPVLFGSALILCWTYLMIDEINVLRLKKVYVIIGIMVSVSAFLLNYRPYREQPVTQLNTSLESISPKLKFIKTTKANFEKYADLKILAQKYRHNYITAPSIPMSHYLFDDESPLPVDWILNFDLANRVPDLLRFSAQKKHYILLEKSFVTLGGEEFLTNRSEQENFSAYALFIFDHCHPIGETEHFLIYDSTEIGKYLSNPK